MAIHDLTRPHLTKEPVPRRFGDWSLIGEGTRTEAAKPAPRASNTRRTRLITLSFDLLGLLAAWQASCEVRLLLNPLMATRVDRVGMTQIAPPIAGVLLLWIAATTWLKLYRPAAVPPLSSEWVRLMESGIIAGTLAAVSTFFSRELGISASRSVVLLFLFTSLMTLSIMRWFACRLTLFLDVRLPVPERMAVVGQGRDVRRLIDDLGSTTHSSSVVVGVVVPAGSSARAMGSPVPLLGTTRQLAEIVNRDRINRLLILDRTLPRRDTEWCEYIAGRMSLPVCRPVIGSEVPHTRLQLSSASGLQVLEFKPVPFTKRQERVKRAMDIVISATLLLLLSPILGLTALLVKITSRGPVLYCSLRVGRGGTRHFTFLKFRSMCSGAHLRQDVLGHNEKGGHIFKLRRDPRVTPIGRVLRQLSIDEMPQLWNVLRGDMSVVGPRPLPAQDLDPDGQSQKFRGWADQRSRVLPGITGLWQISGRSDLTFEQMTELDCYYCRHWSVLLDLRILLRTPLVVLSGRGAY